MSLQRGFSELIRENLFLVIIFNLISHLKMPQLESYPYIFTVLHDIIFKVSYCQNCDYKRSRRIFIGKKDQKVRIFLMNCISLFFTVTSICNYSRGIVTPPRHLDGYSQAIERWSKT